MNRVTSGVRSCISPPALLRRNSRPDPALSPDVGSRQAPSGLQVDQGSERGERLTARANRQTHRSRESSCRRCRSARSGGSCLRRPGRGRRRGTHQHLAPKARRCGASRLPDSAPARLDSGHRAGACPVSDNWGSSNPASRTRCPPCASRWRHAAQGRSPSPRGWRARRSSRKLGAASRSMRKCRSSFSNDDTRLASSSTARRSCNVGACRRASANVSSSSSMYASKMASGVTSMSRASALICSNSRVLPLLFFLLLLMSLSWTAALPPLASRSSRGDVARASLPSVRHAVPHRGQACRG